MYLSCRAVVSSAVHICYRQTQRSDSSSCNSIGTIWQWGRRRDKSGWCERLKTKRDEPWWPLSLPWKEPVGPSCSRKVGDSSLTRNSSVCVCDLGGWPSAGLNGRLMGSGSEPDGLWGALFSLPPPVIHHISSWYWEIAVPHWREGGQGSRLERGWAAGWRQRPGYCTIKGIQC